MVSEEKQNNNLNTFFKEEYHSLKSYVRSKIEHTTESDAEDIIQLAEQFLQVIYITPAIALERKNKRLS